MSPDYELVERMVLRYAMVERVLNLSTSGVQVADARRWINEIKQQAQAMWDAITVDVRSEEAVERLAAAEEDNLLRVLNELRHLDLDSIELALPNTETMEQRGVHT